MFLSFKDMYKSEAKIILHHLLHIETITVNTLVEKISFVADVVISLENFYTSHFIIFLGYRVCMP